MYNCGIFYRILTQRQQIAALKLVRSAVQQITSTPNRTNINLRLWTTLNSALVYCFVLKKSTWNYMLVSVYRLVLSIGTIISFNVTVKRSSMCFPQINASSCKVFVFTSIFKYYYNFSTNFSKAAKFNENLPKLRLTSKLSIRLLSVKKRQYTDGTKERRVPVCNANITH